ncbi:MAG TPA: hypothetical protein VIF37_09210 [Methylobacter sp.]|jgi:hypothetical protein
MPLLILTDGGWKLGGTSKKMVASINGIFVLNCSCLNKADDLMTQDDKNIAEQTTENGLLRKH